MEVKLFLLGVEKKRRIGEVICGKSMERHILSGGKTWVMRTARNFVR